MEPLFPVVDLEAIGDLTDEEINDLIGQHEAAFGRIATGEAFVGMEDPPDFNARKEMAQAGTEALKTLKAARDERVAERERFATEMAEMAEEAGITVEAAAEAEEPAPDDPSEPEPAEPEPDEPAALEVEAEAEPVAEPEPEAVTASAAPPYRHKPPAVPRRHQPIVIEDGFRRATLVASGGMEGIQKGEALDRESLAHALMSELRNFVTTPPGFSQKVVVASAAWEYPEERQLDGASPERDYGKIAKVRNERYENPDGTGALVASGGWCAPSTIRYDIEAMGVTDRPVRDAFTAFQATRGGIRYFPDVSIGGPNAIDTTDGITHLTEAQDEGGTFTKDCVVVECPTDTEVRADIIAACLQAGNLASIAFPELIAAYQDLLGVQAARVRDSLLLDAVIADTNSTVVTETTQTYSALNGLIHNLLRLKAGYISRHRLGVNANFRALAPVWLRELIVDDQDARQFPADTITVDNLAGYISRKTGVAFDWYLDSATGRDQVMGSQSAGDILDFPHIADVLLWPEGGILFIDQGELNLGLVRDSILNETNDVKFFSETFENAAVTAAEVFYGEFTLCPNGVTAGTGTARTC